MTERARSFGSAVDAYERARPAYAVEAVRFALPRVPCTVADVGAGTGKLSGVLLGLGCDVVAVEPDEAMRSRIVVADARAGTAEELPLADASVDAVVAGQAFHWFDAARFADEAVRVLRPGGAVGLLWNEVDDRLPWVQELGRLVAPIGQKFAVEDPEPPLEDARFAPGEVADFPYGQRLDASLLVTLMSSYSRTILLPAAEREAFLADVERFARSHFGDGTFELPYLTRAWRHDLLA